MEHFETVITQALDLVMSEKEEFVVLSPDDIVNHFTFIQACKDESDGYYHVEVGLDQKDSNGYVKILCKDRVVVSDCLEVFKSFYLDGKIDTEEMYDLKW